MSGKRHDFEILPQSRMWRHALVSSLTKSEKSRQRQIFLVEYLTLLRPDTQPGRHVSLSKEQIDRHKGVAEDLRDGYRLAAKAKGVVLVSVMDLSRNHALGSEVPWVEGFSAGVTFSMKVPSHPNAEGMRNVANIWYERLQTLS
jgi:hypothetical protein